ncbi:hypothetical protein G6O69_28705 [Pseudenhygromyxa sp. WMMC2535]|uniref:hypothetical protein n=1 Tax=Pseudenhygromyxa sp. WMMC2535 TaxID=2712867 RepID=UPI0015562021|nr:hypothetical protein [Pseudenhygromyxa sp. WMMC2535]NVB41847.1 hypothetical protein [Pseudenhygromyxa sp. WMMC2535]
MSPPLSLLLIPLAFTQALASAPPAELAVGSRVATPALSGGPRAPRAWALLHAGELWVCWSAAADCWRRVELERPSASSALTADDELDSLGLEALELGSSALVSERAADPTADHAGLRMAFADERTLWIELDAGTDADARRWRVERGRTRARLVDAQATVPLERPRLPSCSPHASIPAIVDGRPAWRSSPTCAHAALRLACPGSRRVRQRRPTGLTLRAGVEFARSIGWRGAGVHAGPDGLRTAGGHELLFIVELGVEPGVRARAARLAQAGHRPRVIASPSVASGPLAAAEAAALAELRCLEIGR